MQKHVLLACLFFGLLLWPTGRVQACSILYYIDKETGNIYVANLEDYLYSTKAYLKVVAGKKGKLSRLWYGWDNFAQGGVNEKGLFFDGAVTPKQPMPTGYHPPQQNLGDRLLAHCTNVAEALLFLETEKVALNNAHMMLGDRQGHAVVLEWVNGKKHVQRISKSYLLATNFLLSDTTQGNFPCPRFRSIEQNIKQLEASGKPISLLSIGNTLNQAAQTPRKINTNETAGTLYASFIDLTAMQFVLVYKLDNERIVKYDLNKLFAQGKNKKIKLEKI